MTTTLREWSDLFGRMMEGKMTEADWGRLRYQIGDLVRDLRVPREAAEDLTQDVLLKLQNEEIRSRILASELPLAYLEQVVRNAYTDTLRRTRRARRAAQQYLEKRPEPLSFFQEVTRDEDIHRVREAISRLSASDQEVIRLFYVEGLKLWEIAEKLDEKPSTVGIRVFRARRRLRENLS